MSRFAAVVLLALSLPAPALAQSHFSTCDLTVHVRTIDDRDLNDRVQVQILSPAGTQIGTAGTNLDGTADFQVSSGVTYVARITGNGIEPTSAEFHIMGGEVSYTENINVKRAAPAGAQRPGGSPTISLEEMNIPAKAKDEMQQGIEAFNKGDMARAQQRFEKAISIYPQYAQAYVNLGIIAAKAGDRFKARTLLSKSIEMDDKFVPGYLALARMNLQEKNYVGAESSLRKVMLSNPSIPDAVALLATAEFGNKKYDQALADAQRVHTLPHHEQFANMHLLAGQILEMQNRPQDALTEYRLFLKEDPGSPQTKMVQQAVTDLENKKR
ncbi:MAG: tetratricopeptide repeat protein [Terriglobales bacterium]